MAGDGWGSDSGGGADGGSEPAASGAVSAWEFLPPQVRFVFVGVIFILLAAVAVGVGDAFNSIGSSMEGYRESLGNDYPRMLSTSEQQEQFEPRKVRRESGILCSIFGSLLRKPQSCE